MKTNKYYTIEGLESGNYLIREKEHDARLKASIQEAAHYIRNHGEGMQLEYCRFAHKWLNGRKPAEVTPMKEKDIHGLLYSFLKSIGVSEVKPCTSGIEPETVERVEVETVETLGISDCTVVPLEESGSIYYILVCSTKAGESLTFAPEKYFPVLFDEGKNSFRTELDALRFDEIDAFISGECVDKIARGECSEEETDRILSESYTDFVGKLKQAS